MSGSAAHSDPLPTVVIVNDSPVARAVIAGVVEASGEYRIAGQATRGIDGVALVLERRPKLVLLDMHMPDINGVEVTRRIMGQRPTRILICSATITRNTTYVFEALKFGALDYIKTPSLSARPGQGVSRDELRQAGAALLRKMQTVLSLPLAGGLPGPSLRPVPAPAPPREVRQGLPPLVAIGCSTGGPTALNQVLQAVPLGFRGAILVSQHIERDFTPGLAQWLNRETGHPVKVAEDGDVPRGGQVYLAQGGRTNLILTGGGRLRYEPSGEAIYYPNINRMFLSVAALAGRACCGVVLTGLGDDGAAGIEAIHLQGGRALVQDPVGATVDGMPRAALKRGVADRGHTLRDLGLQIGRWLEGAG